MGPMVLDQAGAGGEDPHNIDFACLELVLQLLQLGRKSLTEVAARFICHLSRPFVTFDGRLPLDRRPSAKLLPSVLSLANLPLPLSKQGHAIIPDGHVHLGSKTP